MHHDHSALLSLCRELIAIPSPTGCEESIARFLVDYMTHAGYRARIDAVGNVIGVLSGDRPGPRIVLDAHMDTVKVTNHDQWSVDPFGGHVSGGYIYGRGASDMKGALAASVVAAKDFAEAADAFAGEIIISATIAEETFEGMAAAEVARQVCPDLVIVGESTECRLNRGGRGRAEIRLHARGRSAHSSNPDKGINAVYSMAESILDLRRRSAPVHPILGKGILELTDIISSPYPGASVVPEDCWVTYDRRVLPNETPGGVLEDIRSALGTDKNTDVSLVRAEMTTWTGASLGGDRFFPAWLMPVEDRDLQRLLVSLEEEGLYRGLGTYSFCTNATHWAGVASIPTVGYGPSSESGAHVVDERLEVDALFEAYRGYRSMLRGLFSSQVDRNC